MDARDVLVVTPTSDGQSVDVDYPVSNTSLDVWAASHDDPDIIVATGFIARTPSGQCTTLRRNGSDYSATIFGALVQVLISVVCHHEAFVILQMHRVGHLGKYSMCII